MEISMINPPISNLSQYYKYHFDITWQWLILKSFHVLECLFNRQVQAYYNFLPLTSYLSVNYMDRFLYSRRLPVSACRSKFLSWTAERITGIINNDRGKWLINFDYWGTCFWLLKTKKMTQVNWLINLWITVLFTRVTKHCFFLFCPFWINFVDKYYFCFKWTLIEYILFVMSL